jgi:hypothetical protein
VSKPTLSAAVRQRKSRGSAGILPAAAGASRSRHTTKSRVWRGMIRGQSQRTGTCGRDARAPAPSMAILAMTAHGRDARAIAGRMPALRPRDLRRWA